MVLIIKYEKQESFVINSLQGIPWRSGGLGLPANSGKAGSIPGSGRYPREGNGNPLQYSCLENPMNRGAWRATVHGIEKSQTEQLGMYASACITDSLCCIAESINKATL